MAIYTAAAAGGNWNSAATWGGAGFPGLADTALFNELSGPVTVTSGAACLELNLNSGTGYANTITFANTLIVYSGNITFSSKTTLQGFAMVGPNGILWTNGGNITRTVTSFTVPFNLPFSSAGSGGNIFTLTGDFTVSNFSNASIGSFNGSNLIINGNVTGSISGGGTSSSILSGLTTTWSAGTLNRVIINSLGTVTLSGSLICTTSIIWTAGTLVATGSSVSMSNATSISLGGQTLNNFSFSYSTILTCTVTGNFNLTGNLNLQGGGSILNGTGKVFVGGNVIAVGGGGTFTVEMNGTGTLSGTTYHAIIVNSPSNTITVGALCSVNNFTLTAGTLNLANQLGLNGGTLIIAPGFTFTGSSDLIITASANITSNSVAWPTSVIIANPLNVITTVTINDNLTVNGSFTSTSTYATAQNLNNGPLNVNQNLTMTNNIQGTSNITLLGSSTTIWSGAGQVGNNLTINKTGNFTVSGSVSFGNGKTLTYTTVGGIFTITGSTLFLTDCTLTLGSSVWNNLSIRPAGGSGSSGYTVVLSADLYINGTFSSGNVGTGAYGQAILNGSNLYVSGSLIAGQANYNNISGTSKIILAGTGTISGLSFVCVNLDITGTYSAVNWGFSYNGTFGQDNKTFRVLGTFTHTGTLTVGNCTLTIGSSTLNNLLIAPAGGSGTYYTITLTQNTIVTGNFTVNGSITGQYGNGAVNGLFNLYVGGNLSMPNTLCTLIGTATIILNGTGIWSGGNPGVSGYAIDIIINSPTGVISTNNVTITGSKRILCTSAGTFNPTGYIYIQGAPILNAGSFVWNDIYMGVNTILTLESSVTIRDLVMPSGLGGSGHTINGIGFIINITRNLTHSNTAQVIGTAKLRMMGSGTWACSASGTLGLDLELDSPSGTIIIGTIVVFGQGKTLKYTNVGTLTTTGSTLNIPIANSAILDLQNISWNNLSMPYNCTLTLLSASNFNNVTLGTAAVGSTLLINGLFNFNVRGNLTNNQTSGGVTGTGTIRFTGIGNWGGSASVLANPVIIDTIGTITLTSNITWGLAGRAFTVTSGTLNMGAITFTVISGTTVTLDSIITLNASSSTLVVSGIASTIFNTNNKNFFNITIPANGNISISSSLSIVGTLALLGTTTFTGTAGWTCGTLTCSTPSAIITLQQAITYITTTNVIMLGTNAGKILMRSSDLIIPYVSAIWTLVNTPATQSMVYVSATAIDSSAGMTIWSFGGIIDLSTQNWALGASQGTKAFTYVS